MTEAAADPRRLAVWTSMADHFLDTETRHDIPLTALACVDAGLSVVEAKLVWQDEVAPVVGANLFDVAGEWAGWDREWLVRNIEGQRKGSALPGPCRWLRYWLCGGIINGVWVAVARCMDLLLTVPDVARRQELARDLRCLARHYFDSCPPDISKLEPAQRARLLHLAEPLLGLLQPALVPGERRAAAARVKAAMADIEAEVPPSLDLGALRRKFASVVRAAGGTGNADRTFAALVRRYSEGSRHYHSLRHVDACLDWLDWCHGLAQRPAEVALALWFHDAVYEPRASDNEKRSAEFAQIELAALGVHPDACDRIAQHILATERHMAHADGALVVDIDLAILGSREREFARFERQIRREYACVDDAAFRAGRCHVLRSFLARPHIYAFPALRQELEQRARTNLERRILELSTGSESIA